MSDSIPTILRMAATQHGVVPGWQARNAGIPQMTLTRALRSGVVHRPHRDVYVASGAPTSWRQELAIRIFAAGPDAVASHHAAFSLWCPDAGRPPRLDVTTARPVRRSQHDPHTHRTRRLLDADRAVVDRLPTVGLARSLYDMAAVETTDRIVDAIDYARRTVDLAVGSLLRCLDRYRGRGWPGTATFEEAIARLGPTIPDSSFERIVLDAISDAGLPAPTLHHVVRVDGVVMAVDLAWPGRWVVVELDGAHHRDTRQVEVDRRRDARLEGLGYQVLRVSWWEWVTDRAAILDRLAAMLVLAPAS